MTRSGRDYQGKLLDLERDDCIICLPEQLVLKLGGKQLQSIIDVEGANNQDSENVNSDARSNNEEPRRNSPNPNHHFQRAPLNQANQQ